MGDAEKKVICKNRRARFEYHIEETFEAGLVLQGSEVKSLRSGSADLSDSYGRIRNGELFLVKAHIAAYDQARVNHEPERDRKLLMHRREINRIGSRLRERGFTLVPIQMYFKDGVAKVKVGLARGKRQHDKRRATAKRESERDLQRALKRERRGR